MIAPVAFGLSACKKKSTGGNDKNPDVVKPVDPPVVDPVVPNPTPVIPVTPVNVPSAPRNLVIKVNESMLNVEVTWDKPETNNESIIRYETSVDNGKTWSNNYKSQKFEYTDYVNGAVFKFKVRAVSENGAGEAASIEKEILTKPRAVGTVLEIDTHVDPYKPGKWLVGTTQVTLSWTANADPTVTFEIVVKAASNSNTADFTGKKYTASTTSYTFTAAELTALGTSIDFYVRAVNSKGASTVVKRGGFSTQP
jgi:predicted phage tail protein